MAGKYTQRAPERPTTSQWGQECNSRRGQKKKKKGGQVTGLDPNTKSPRVTRRGISFSRKEKLMIKWELYLYYKVLIGYMYFLKLSFINFYMENYSLFWFM